VRGDELSPVDAVQRIMAGLDPAKISGTVIAVYDLSRPAKEYTQRQWPLAQGGGSLIDFNRVWPGNETGNNAPTRHAGMLWNRLFKNNIDVALDYHTASTGGETFQRFLDDPILAPWKIALIKLRRYKPHTLPEREERLLTLAAPVIRGHSDTFSQLTNVDMKFGSLSAEGQELELSQSSYFSFLNNRDRDLRRKAFHQFYAEFDDHKYSLASALSSSVRADVFSAKIRNHPSAREASLFHDNIPLAV